MRNILIVVRRYAEKPCWTALVAMRRGSLASGGHKWLRGLSRGHVKTLSGSEPPAPMRIYPNQQQETPDEHDPIHARHARS